MWNPRVYFLNFLLYHTEVLIVIIMMYIVSDIYYLMIWHFYLFTIFLQLFLLPSNNSDNHKYDLLLYVCLFDFEV